MSWSYRLGRVAGTDIKVHVTFLLVVGWWALLGYSQGGPAGALTGVLYLLALFACILLHEFGHILMAKRFGVRTPDVILLPIGGVARLERIPEEPRQELVVALARPAVSLLIAARSLPGARRPRAPRGTRGGQFGRRPARSPALGEHVPRRLQPD